MTRFYQGFGAALGCALLVACGNQAGSTTSGNQGSARIVDGHSPSGKAGEITFSGAIDGKSQATHESCEGGGRVFRHFTVMATGDIAGRQYFLSASVYPYQGPATYELRALPHVPLDYLSTPNPLIDEAPGGTLASSISSRSQIQAMHLRVFYPMLLCQRWRSTPANKPAGSIYR